MNSIKYYKEILGINRRNQEYVRIYNPSSSKKISDNKILTKRILSKSNIRTPKIAKIIRTKKQLEFLNWETLPKSFVVKPNRGTGGNGIIVFYGKKKGELSWIRSNQKIMTKEQLRIHFEKILDGLYSMGNSRDMVLIEERILNNPILKNYSYRGVPDVRIIVFNKVPVMAMIRFPTKFSDGKSNLHSGGICAGIDMATGLTTNAIQLKKRSILENTYKDIELTSDFKQNKTIKGLKIPYWNEILDISIQCQEITNIGFLGVDIAIDQNRGPLVFELNSRPGLGIQIANKSGLRPKLERVKNIEIKSRERAIRISKTLFGGEIEEEIEALSGREVVNLIEKIIIYNNKKTKSKNETQTVKGLLDTGILISRIDEGLANRMGYDEIINDFKKLETPKTFETIEEAKRFIKEQNINEKIYRLTTIVENSQIKIKPVIKVQIKIADEIKEIEAILTTQKETIYPILIGRRELKNYLIDASKTFVK